MVKVMSVLVIAGVCACGGDPARPVDPPESSLLVGLSATQIESLCGWEAGVFGDPRTVTCSNGDSVTISDESECESGFANLPATCTATVGNAEDCVDSVADDPCGLGGAACAALESCAN
jgi:hypothetical protein